jgi:hypothetical protein
LVFLAVAVFYDRLATIDRNLSDSQIFLTTVALKTIDGRLFSADPLFSSATVPPSLSPVFVSVLKGVLLTAPGDPILPLRVLVGPLTLLYLLGMYSLLYRQSRSWSIATFVAVLSTVVIKALGGSAWGMGTLASVGPAALPLALTPLIVLFLLDAVSQTGPRWRLGAIFLVVGLLGHFDLDWAINMGIVLAGVYLAQRRFTAFSWVAVVGCLVLAAAGTMPYLIQYVRTRLAVSSVSGQAQTLCWALREGGQAMLYPQALRALPDWLVWFVPPAILVVAVLSQVDRFRVPLLGFWIAFAVWAVAVAVVFQASSQLVGLATGTIPPWTGFVQASCFLMLPLYALFAQALTGLFRLARGHHGLMRAACAVAAAAWLIPSANLAPARHATYAAASVLLSEENKPRRLRKIQESLSRDAELVAIARWAVTHTPIDAVFLTDQSRFRLLSRRAIVAGEDDGGALRCYWPERLADWRRRLERQDPLLHPVSGQADPAAINQFVGELSSQGPFVATGNWYVLLPASAAPEGSTILTEETAPPWGRSYRLYRLR